MRAAAGGGDGGENTGHFLKPESSSFCSFSPHPLPAAAAGVRHPGLSPSTPGWGVRARAPEARLRTAAPPLAGWLSLPPPCRRRDEAKPSERARAAQRAPGGSRSGSREAGTRGVQRAAGRRRPDCQQVSGAHGRPVGVGQAGRGLVGGGGSARGAVSSPCSDAAPVAPGEDGPSSAIAWASPGWRARLSAAARRAWGAASRAAAAAEEDARCESSAREV